MTSTQEPVVAAGGSDAAVRDATGRGWADWFAILDTFDVRAHGHTAAARHLSEAHGCPDWWCQMVTVGYEQAHGLRQKHQKADGFAVSGSKTVPVPIGALYLAWADESARRRWLPEPLTVRKATPNKSMRITWADGSSVHVYFWVKGEAKSQVQVNHEKLPNEASAATMKVFWAAALARMARLIATTG